MTSHSALEEFRLKGGTVRYVYPPIPIRTHDYAATHPDFTDKETGGEYDMAYGRTAEEAARNALDYLEERDE